MTIENEKILQFKYKGSILKVPDYSYFIPYATFFAGEYDFLKPKKTDIVLDVGANIGDYTLKIAKSVGKVIAIEPSSENFAFLENNIKPFSNVIIIKKAVGNQKGKVNFSSSGGVVAKVDLKGSDVVDMDTLDNICDELNIKPDLLKMDIEGYEGSALLGFQKHLKNIKRMVIEIHNEENKSTCEKILSDSGFHFRYQSKLDIFKKTLKNVTTHSLSFMKYDVINNYYAMKTVAKFPFTRKTNIPSCGEVKDMYLMEAWQ